MTEVDYDPISSDVDLRPYEMGIFVRNGKIKVFNESADDKIVLFTDDNVRNNIIQSYLVYHVKYMYSLIKDNEKAIIYLEFKNDREILNVGLAPKYHQYLIKIVTNTSKFKSDHPELSSYVDKFEYKKHMNNIIINVSQIEKVITNNIDLHVLFARVPVPVELYDGRIVNMTYYQKSVLLAPETKVTFYANGDQLEPAILDETLRNNLIKGMIYILIKNKIINNVDKDDDNSDSHKLYTINIKDGDKGLVDISNGFLSYKCCEEGKLSDYETNTFYNDIKSAYDEIINNPDELIFVINIYKPGTEELLIGSWMQINKPSVIKLGDSLVKNEDN